MRTFIPKRDVYCFENKTLNLIVSKVYIKFDISKP